MTDDLKLDLMAACSLALQVITELAPYVDDDSDPYDVFKSEKIRWAYAKIEAAYDRALEDRS